MPPMVSIIIPCRNEADFITNCIDSVLLNDYPQSKLEVLVIDGMSIDATRQILARYAERYPVVKVIDNPRRVTPAALNIGVAAACGEIVIRMDAHTVYRRDYIARCVDALCHSDADDVGGVLRTIAHDEGILGGAIVKSLSHPFGVGGSRFRYANPTEPEFVDTVPFFCCRKETLLRVGPFNERLVRSQDMEFNRRLRRTGGKILMVPGIVAYYYPRTDYRSFIRHNFNNGVWAILPFAYADQFPVSARHLIPLAFVITIFAAGLAAIEWPMAKWLFLLVLTLYGFANLFISLLIACRESRLGYAVALPVAFAGLHLAYGSGSLWGLIKLAAKREYWRRLFRKY
jgi:cellulose synthase/poly-beta-1,6-N-acetylglucosamine synthase-like glycosyltransferase